MGGRGGGGVEMEGDDEDGEDEESGRQGGGKDEEETGWGWPGLSPVGRGCAAPVGVARVPAGRRRVGLGPLLPGASGDSAPSPLSDWELGAGSWELGAGSWEAAVRLAVRRRGRPWW